MFHLRPVGKVVTFMFGLWIWAAILGLLLEKHYPVLGSFARFTFLFLWVSFVVCGVGLIVIGPGVYVAKEVYNYVSKAEVSSLEVRLTQIWSAIAGFLLSLLLGGAVAFIFFGPLQDVKLWFIGICWTVLFIPWCILGFFGRKVIRRFSPPSGATLK